jgi:hypothetical protein
MKAGNAIGSEIHGMAFGFEIIKQIRSKITVIFDQKNIHYVVLKSMNGGVDLTGYSLPLPERLILKTSFKEFACITFTILCHSRICKILSSLSGN